VGSLDQLTGDMVIDYPIERQGSWICELMCKRCSDVREEREMSMFHIHTAIAAYEGSDPVFQLGHAGQYVRAYSLRGSQYSTICPCLMRMSSTYLPNSYPQYIVLHTRL
jgi:hypothetical protein